MCTLCAPILCARRRRQRRFSSSLSLFSLAYTVLRCRFCCTTAAAAAAAGLSPAALARCAAAAAAAPLACCAVWLRFVCVCNGQTWFGGGSEHCQLDGRAELVAPRAARSARPFWPTERMVGREREKQEQRARKRCGRCRSIGSSSSSSSSGEGSLKCVCKIGRKKRTFRSSAADVV